MRLALSSVNVEVQCTKMAKLSRRLLPHIVMAAILALFPYHHAVRADFSGCKDLPYKPICGSNMRTYPNDCFLDVYNRVVNGTKIEKTKDGPCFENIEDLEGENYEVLYSDGGYEKDQPMDYKGGWLGEDITGPHSEPTPPDNLDGVPVLAEVPVEEFAEAPYNPFKPSEYHEKIRPPHDQPIGSTSGAQNGVTQSPTNMSPTASKPSSYHGPSVPY